MPMGGVAYWKRTLLYVNIDSIATLRETRGEKESDPVQGALICERAGCDGISVSLGRGGLGLREEDIFAVKEATRGIFNLEIPLSDELTHLAQKIKPASVTIVPEGSGEAVEPSGLKISMHSKIKETVNLFKDQGISVSLLVDPDPEAVQLASDCEADSVELHTGAYGRALDEKVMERELNRIYQAANVAAHIGIKANAGHGLTFRNIDPVLDARGILKVTVGNAVLSRAASVGLAKAVDEMCAILE